MSTAVANRVRALSEVLALTRDDVARIVGASARTVDRWAGGAVEPQREARERLLELGAVVEALVAVLRPDDARLWLFTPNPLLGYEKPADRIRKGDYASVIALIEALADGVVT